MAATSSLIIQKMGQTLGMSALVGTFSYTCMYVCVWCGVQHPRRRKHLVFGGLPHQPLFVYGVIVKYIICSLFLKQQVKQADEALLVELGAKRLG